MLLIYLNEVIIMQLISIQNNYLFNLLVKEKFGKVDILINNAVHGTWMCDIMDEKSIEIFEKVINVNIKCVADPSFLLLRDSFF